MSDNDAYKSDSGNILTSPENYFLDVVGEAFVHRNIETYPQVTEYLANLLEFYVPTDNLFDIDEDTGKKSRETLAEMYLRAINSENNIKIELLKKLGDVSLYISGFFGDSLKRKIVDVDYYVGIGCSAYGSLAAKSTEDLSAKVYSEFSVRFMDFVDVLTFISQRVKIQSDEDLLRLYDRYVSTGSELAKEQLLENGVLVTDEVKKLTYQD